MIKNVDELKNRIRQGGEFDFIGFWGNHFDTPEEATFSNFYTTSFIYDVNLDNWVNSTNAVVFNSSEQFFMYKKAMHFKDYTSVRKILEPGHSPFHYKKLGRNVRDYNDEEWAKVRYGYMIEALTLKYDQNLDLLEILLETGNSVLVECSPFDRIWGIGLSKYNKDGNPESKWKDPLQWKGQNLLGFALMEVRDEMRKYYRK